MTKEAEIRENIPKKVIGVNKLTNDLSASIIPTARKVEDNTFDSDTLIPKTTSVNSSDVINAWEKIHSKRIKGKLRSVAEYVAKQNLARKLPTTKDIKVHLGISKEYCKKILAKARRIGLLKTHEDRFGHQFKYCVTNIQNYIILEDSNPNSEESDDEGGEINLQKDLLFPLAILNDLFEGENLSFHHISLKSKLRDVADYDRLNWRIGSRWNKGKTFELKISKYRQCVFTVSPNGTVSMVIKCSDDPLYLTTLDDVTNFFSICGEIHSVLKAETSNSEPLVDDVPDWKLTQIDAAFDIPLSAPENNHQPQVSNGQKGLLSYSNFGTFRLKYLGQFYQIYSKNVLHKDKVLRIERRFSFLENQPTVNTMIERIKKDSTIA